MKDVRCSAEELPCAAAKNINRIMKGRAMKKRVFAAVMAAGICFLFSAVAPAQNKDESKEASVIKDVRERPDDSASLTAAQKAAVKSILSKYKAATLTAADAKAIHNAFRDAGLKSGPGLNQAVTAAGWNPDKLRDLDPPPDMKDRGQNKQ
jgi:hypothetical protein